MEEPQAVSQPLGTPEMTPQQDEFAPTPTGRKRISDRRLPTDSLISISLTESSNRNSFASDRRSTIFDASDPLFDDLSPNVSLISPSLISPQTPGDDVPPSSPASSAPTSPMQTSSRTSTSSDTESLQVDWEQLEREEEQEDADAESDEHTSLLLARLEQENAALTADPKSGIKQRVRAQSRPPSVYQLKKLVQEKGTTSVRFSLLPAAAPMTELDFWAALVQDYLQTAQRLPTVTSNKIRAGVPAPLRGVVWQSMAGARDAELEDQYDEFCQQSSPYETIINKDIGRSFPAVAMFRDADGDGQRMLASVLKCYSLYDTEIGYCQGLGFLVGPLLMNMGDKAAFCVLVRLMEDYDLRSCFLPNLAGLHLRIYQFQKLFDQALPELAQHLAKLEVEGTYLSQWFLSFFATTSPLPMLFRIYDVIFAEGATETIMRVALSIMKRNESKLLGFTEFEDAMQLLLGRALWDPYGLTPTSADDLVNDFVVFTNVVTRESLQALETSFKESKDVESGESSRFFPSVQQAASRFLQRRLWTSHSSSKSQPIINNPPGLTPCSSTFARPHSMLLRTPSKQSLSTLYSVGESTDGSVGTMSTAMTDMSRDSPADEMSIKSIKSPTESTTSGRAPSTMSTKDRDLHCQIEDLLTALTEMQRENAALAALLQRERDERSEDRTVVKNLVDQLKSELTPASERRGRRMTESDLAANLEQTPAKLSEGVTKLIETVDLYLTNSTDQRQNRKSSIFESKQQLRQVNVSLQEQLQNETLTRLELSRQLQDKEQEASGLRDEVQKSRLRIKEGHAERERLQKTVQELKKSRSRSGSGGSANEELSLRSSIARSDTIMSDDSDKASTTGGGLREFKLGRTVSGFLRSPIVATTPTFNKRISSLGAGALMHSATAPPEAFSSTTPPQQDESLLQELVAAKTAEAVARQEVDELKAKFESMRKLMLGISTAVQPATPAITEPPTPLSRSSSGGSGFALSLGVSASPPRANKPRPAALPIPPLNSLLTKPSRENLTLKSPNMDSAPMTARTPGSAWGTGFFGWGKRNASAQALPVESQ